MTTDNGKPRGKCTGCPFDYQLGTARSGEFKGQLVIRKHNSRTGPGLCDGASKPPAVEQGEATGDAQAFGADQFADPGTVDEPLHRAEFDSTGSCGHEIMAGEDIRPDGDGGWLCGLCSDEGPAPDRPQHVYENGNGGVYVHEGEREACRQDECVTATVITPEQLPHDRQAAELINVPGAPVASVKPIPHGHDVTDTSGNTYRHGGSLADCTTPNCVQFRNRTDPPPVQTPVTHQCANGLFADMRNCPEHGVTTPVFAVAPGHAPAGHLNGVPVGHTHQAGGELHQGQQQDCALHPCTTMAGLVLPAAPVGPIVQFVDPSPVAEPAAVAAPAAAQQFAAPEQVAVELPPVNGQPKEERDRWGRYLLPAGGTGKPTGHTRATTFAKLGSSTYALGEWNERMLIRGLVMRPDLLAQASGLDVKLHRETLNGIADQAQETAGNKVAADIGTSYHTYTEYLEAGAMTLDEVPERWRPRCAQYMAQVAAYGLRTRPDWIERTTMVTAAQVSAPVGVGGKLDRIYELPNGELVIGDLKTSSNIEYSWSEIAVQLAIYAHGVNTHGMYDWNAHRWETLGQPVRTDYAIVMHLPAAGTGCDMYRVDIKRGWEFAQVSGLVQARQKAKGVASALLVEEIPKPVVVQQIEPENPLVATAMRLISEATHPDGLGALYEYAQQSGQFSAGELELIRTTCSARWSELNVPF